LAIYIINLTFYVKNNPSLTILNIAQSDEANYICSATNIAGTSSSQQAFLDVTGSKYFN
jgi:hypothetical protein